MDQHEEKLKVESYIRIENFGICMKSTKGFEQRKMFFVIHISLRLLCSSYQHLKLMSNPNFIMLIIISKFCN